MVRDIGAALDVAYQLAVSQKSLLAQPQGGCMTSSRFYRSTSGQLPASTVGI